MHKKFYASGFIYHLPSEQILLLQPQPISSAWILFEKEYTSERPEKVFRDNIFKFLGIDVGIIYPIYSYFNETTKHNRSLFYAITKDLQEFLPKNNHTFEWFSFNEVLKIEATEQIKHDIVVGQRVIDAERRRKAGENTL